MTELLERIAADIGGRYVLERELGRGGMATVYLARDLETDRAVAIKVMDPELAAVVGGERFRREIAVASRLRHPHILGILDAGEAAGTSYYVMPYVAGETLRARLEREKQLPIEDAIRIARAVADALAYAHANGVIHRDVKPENILLDEQGSALVADFGIARAASVEGGNTLTRTGTALGTPYYMSPEQIFGEKDIDGRTDQYALGCLLHEMLAGQPPFVGPHAQSLMAQHALDDPPLVTRFRPSTPANVEDAIYTALAKTRADRFATLEDFSRAIENSGYTSLMKVTRIQRLTMQGQPAAPPPAPTWKRAAIGAAALLLLVAGGAGAWTWASRGRAASARNAALTAELRRIAVLPFEAHGEGDVAAFADGLTEDLTARLRGVKDLTIATRNAVAPFRGQAVTDSTVATALGVYTLVTGSVESQGDRLAVNVVLRDRNGAEIDRVTVTQPRATALALRDSLAERVAEQLRTLLGDKVRLAEVRASTTSAQAWTLLQRGERARRDADSLARAEQAAAALTRLAVADSLFDAAAALDPQWGAPPLGRARTAIARVGLAGRDRPAAAPWLDSAEAASGRAIALDPELADAYAARGTARADRLLMELVPKADVKVAFAAAAADLDTATSWDPTLAAAWAMRGQLEYAEKRPEQAKMYTMKAWEADAYLADAPQILYRLFASSQDLNSYDDARKYCDEGGRRFPAQPRFVYCRLLVHMMPGADGITTAPAVWRSFDSLRTMVGPEGWKGLEHEAQMFAAAGLIRAGLADSARRVMMRARVENPADDPTGELQGLEAFVRAQLGDRAEAVRILQRYVAEHPQHIAGFRQADFWWWRPLRDEPGFRDILRLAKAQ